MQARLAPLLLALFVAGCSADPAASSARSVPLAQTGAPTDDPTMALGSTPVVAPEVVPTVGASATVGPEVSLLATSVVPPDAPASATAQALVGSNVPASATPEAGAAVGLSDGTVPTAGQAVADPACDDTVRPDALPAPGSARSQDFLRSFRAPLAPAPLYDPPGQRHVGLQAGHWLTDQVPPELGRLQAGAVGGGKHEWQVNLDVAQRTAALLQAAGVLVDVLPSTIPPRYRANAFIALHADGDPAGQARGFKVARPGFSSLQDVDDRLVDTLNQVYGADTELPRDDEHISVRMRYYYAFNSRRYCHAVAPGVPQAIVEMAYLTSPVDRGLLIGNPDRLARGLADAIETFLATLP
jgi:N-acetylmuramoyl-L-alanine amidase